MRVICCVCHTVIDERPEHEGAETHTYCAEHRREMLEEIRKAHLVVREERWQ